jgi:hypothetical protein
MSAAYDSIIDVCAGNRRLQRQLKTLSEASFTLLLEPQEVCEATPCVRTASRHALICNSCADLFAAAW